MSNPTLSLGNIEIIALTDARGPFPFPVTSAFPTVPADAWDALRAQYPNTFSDANHLVGQVTCYLIRHPQHTILVDTGLGITNSFAAAMPLKGRLLIELAREGVAASDIDTVFLTHLHQDHVSWNITYENNIARPTFPNARYLAPRADWEMSQQLLATNPEAFAHVREQILPLDAWGRLSIISGETEIAKGICAMETPGHSPGHMSIEIESNDGETVLLAGDAFYHPLQLNAPSHHFAADADASIANATRSHLLEQILQKNMFVAACHFEVGFGRVREEGGKRMWERV